LWRGGLGYEAYSSIARDETVDAQLVEAVIGILSIGTIRPTKVLLTKMKMTAGGFNECNSD
jgi:hypothetical protein